MFELVINWPPRTLDLEEIELTFLLFCRVGVVEAERERAGVGVAPIALIYEACAAARGFADNW